MCLYISFAFDGQIIPASLSWILTIERSFNLQRRLIHENAREQDSGSDTSYLFRRQRHARGPHSSTTGTSGRDCRIGGAGESAGRVELGPFGAVDVVARRAASESVAAFRASGVEVGSSGRRLGGGLDTSSRSSTSSPGEPLYLHGGAGAPEDEEDLTSSRSSTSSPGVPLYMHPGELGPLPMSPGPDPDSTPSSTLFLSRGLTRRGRRTQDRRRGWRR